MGGIAEDRRPGVPKLVSDRGIPSVVVAPPDRARAFSSTTSLRKANGGTGVPPVPPRSRPLPLTPLQLAVQPSKNVLLNRNSLNLCASFRHRMTSPSKMPFPNCPSKLTNAPSLPLSPQSQSPPCPAPPAVGASTNGAKRGDHECFYSRCENRATCG